MQGEAKGEVKGEAKTLARNVAQLLRNKKLSPEEIADALEISLNYVKEIEKNLK
jgi:transcriptional regulator with XRE-family HTH domain